MDYSHWLFKEVKWVFSAVCAVFIFVVLISYSPADSAWSFVSDRPLAVSNFGGLLGAWIADFLLYFFGIGAYLLPISLLLQLIHLPLYVKQQSAWVRFLTLMMVGLAFSVLGTLSRAPYLYPESSGGLVGEWIVAYAVPWMGYTGTVLLFLFVLFCGVTVALGISWLGLLESIGFLAERLACWCYAQVVAWWAGSSVPASETAAAPMSDDDDDDLADEEEGEAEDEEAQGPLLDEEDETVDALDDDFWKEVRAAEALDEEEKASAQHASLEAQLKALFEDPALLTTPSSSVPEAGARPSALSEPARKVTAVSRRKKRYVPPPVRLLQEGSDLPAAWTPTELEEHARLIETKLREFGVMVRVVSAFPGPVITRYEIEPDVGVKGAQIVNLVKDLARSLSVLSIRVVETIPGKSCMGLEVPNQERQVVYLSDLIRSPAYRRAETPLTMVLGKDIAGQPVVVDLSKMPHLLVAGTTGSGKSVGINTMILSLIYRLTPDQMRMLLIDPKILELSVYEDTPHLLSPVVTDMKKATRALSWCVSEMERRYQLMSAASVRHITGFNDKVQANEGDAAFAMKVLGFEGVLQPLPHIVVVIDEFADLMMVVGKKIEELIARLAQKARAAGIHLILATQRPSVDVITGLIKANIPTRIAFQVSSKIDSRTIIDQMGAESLLGQGDMLYLPPGVGYPWRVHGAYVSDEEVQGVTSFLREHNQVNYCLDWDGESETADIKSEEMEEDPLYTEAVQVVLQSRRPSISLVQRHLRVGYNRAARLLEKMEKEGIVSSMNAAGARDILVSKE